MAPPLPRGPLGNVAVVAVVVRTPAVCELGNIGGWVWCGRAYLRRRSRETAGCSGLPVIDAPALHTATSSAFMRACCLHGHMAPAFIATHVSLRTAVSIALPVATRKEQTLYLTDSQNLRI